MTVPSPLLLQEQVIALYPSLVRVLGGHDLAAFVQQVHFRSAVGPERDGHRWAVLTTAEWCDDVVLTPKQFKRIVAALVELGVIVRSAADTGIDRTAWTRVDYDRLEAVRNGPDALVPNGPDGRSLSGPMSLVPNGPDVPLPKNLEELENTFPVAASPHGLKSESVACPQGPRAGGCGAEAGSPCVDRSGPGKQPPRYRGRSHTVRVAHVLTADWWDAVTSRTEHPPAGVKFLAVRAIARTMLDAGWSHSAVAGAIEQLHSEGRPLSGQSVEARLRGAFPGQRLSVVTQTARTIARTVAGDAPPLPEFGSRPIFAPTSGVPRAIGR